MKLDTVFVLEHAAWPALLVDGSGKISRANEAAVRLFGPPVEGGASLLSAIWSPENQITAEHFLADWERNPSGTTSLKFRVKGGMSQPFPSSICSFTRDEQKFFIIQLPGENHHAVPGPNLKDVNGSSPVAHKQRLDCALQLARTVSLDFNNALTSILGHTSLVLTKMEPDNPWRKSLIEVEKSAGRAAEIANDLGVFSQQEKEPRGQSSGNLNVLLQRSVDCLRPTFGPELVSWSLQLERKLFTAKFDEAKMFQAFVKVLENAAQSLRGSGRIIVHTRNIELHECSQDLSVKLAAGSYVCVEISDNGCGIEAEVLPRVFEPFFTTKATRGHRGLGLAWVYGIVTNHGGGVAVSSQPMVGTSVRVYLPAEKRIVKDNGATTIEDLKGTANVLMVDDEDLLLTMGQTILSAYGYTVHTANSGRQALEVIATASPSIELVVTDLVMPGMSGRELIERIQQISPSTRILCTTGYVRPLHQPDDSNYLQKPFTSQHLLIRVKQALYEDTVAV
jgi:two-component system cell cycle sensor histidine kinase/response regulator CckA